MKVKCTLTPLPYLFCYLLLLSYVGQIAQFDAVPWWLNEGSYASYSISFIFLHTSRDRHYRNFRVTYKWECIKIEEGKVFLKVTINGSAVLRYEKGSEPVNISKELTVIIDLATEICKVGNKTGFHALWFPINVNKGENISIGTYQGREYIGEVHGSLMDISIPYGKIKGEDYWFMMITAEGVSNNASVQDWLKGSICYDKNTGLTLCGDFVDPVLKEILEYEDGLSSEIFFYQLKSTNVFEGPEVEERWRPRFWAGIALVIVSLVLFSMGLLKSKLHPGMSR